MSPRERELFWHWANNLQVAQTHWSDKICNGVAIHIGMSFAWKWAPHNQSLDRRTPNPPSSDANPC